MASQVVVVAIPEPLTRRIEALRKAGAVGSARPPRGAVLRAAIELGLPMLEATSGAEQAPTPPRAA